MAWGLGVCPSVRPSVTPWHCIKTATPRITKSSLWVASTSLVFRDKISCPWVRRFPSKEGVKEGYPMKRRYFAVIGSYMVKMAADRYRHAAYHNKHWWQAFYIYQHQWPWTTLNPQKGVFNEFFLIFGCSAHFNTELFSNYLYNLKLKIVITTFMHVNCLTVSVNGLECARHQVLFNVIFLNVITYWRHDSFVWY